MGTFRCNLDSNATYNRGNNSFAYPAANTNAATADSTTHLQNQNYQVCVRRAAGMCYICWAAWHTGPPGSFGLSNPSADDADAATGTECIGDYITVRSF